MMEARIQHLIEEGRKPACLIMEAAMMNLGVVLPEPGYLQAVRDITKKYGIVLIFDEVKTGICTARGGAVERFGVVPDMATLAKALAGGFRRAPSAAAMRSWRGGERKCLSGGYLHGNPLSMAAARASLEQVMTGRAYTHLEYLNDRLIRECDAIAAKYHFPAYTVGIRSKGCVNLPAARSPTTSRSSSTRITNCGPGLAVQLQPRSHHGAGREEEWTLSVQHTDEDIDRYVSAYQELVHDVMD